jgi:hypothetical protein
VFYRRQDENRAVALAVVKADYRGKVNKKELRKHYGKQS